MPGQLSATVGLPVMVGTVSFVHITVVLAGQVMFGGVLSIVI